MWVSLARLNPIELLNVVLRIIRKYSLQQRRPSWFINLSHENSMKTGQEGK